MKNTILTRLLAQLIFGWDTTIGIGLYVILSYSFNEPANLWFLLWAGFCAYLPDLDFTYFIFQSKEVRKWGHWRYGFHHPILFLPVVGATAYLISSNLFVDQVTFLTTLAVVCVFGHFIHDSTKVGLHWFSPITRDWRISFNPLRWLNIKVSTVGLYVLSQDEVAARYEATARKSLEGGKGDEIDARIESVTTPQLICFAVSSIGCIILFCS